MMSMHRHAFHGRPHTVHLRWYPILFCRALLCTAQVTCSTPFGHVTPHAYLVKALTETAEGLFHATALRERGQSPCAAPFATSHCPQRRPPAPADGSTPHQSPSEHSVSSQPHTGVESGCPHCRGHGLGGGRCSSYTAQGILATSPADPPVPSGTSPNCRAAWSVRIVNSAPHRYGWKCSRLFTTANSSLLVTQYSCVLAC